MKTIILCLVVMMTSLIPTHTIAKTLEKVWEVEGFKMPESVVYDAKRQQYYVSNINKEPLKQDHNGSIGIIKENGKDRIIEWISGLSSPKGLALDGDTLYAADVNELVIIDVEKKKIIKRLSSPGSPMLNGIAIGKNNVFVSDWMGNAIYTVEETELKVWAKADEFDSPNGLFVQGDYLYIGAWGNKTRADFTTETSGSFKRISLKTKKIETLSKGDRWMNLDGLHAINDNQFLASDFIKGQILQIHINGEVKAIFDVGKTAADFYYRKDKGLLIVPYLMGNKVVAFKYINNNEQ